MGTIEERAKEYSHSTLVGSQNIKETSYIQGGKDVLKELIMTISVSEDDSLKDNLIQLIHELKGDLCLKEEIMDVELPF